MTFAEMYGMVKTYLGSRDDVTDAVAKAAVNDIYLELGMSYQFFELEGIDTSITTSSGTAGYNIPSGTRTIMQVRDTTNKCKLTPKDVDWYADKDVASTNAGIPEYYIRYGTKIYFYPTPNGSYAMQIWRKTLPTAMSTDGQSPVYPSEWHMAIVLLASSQLCFRFSLDDKGMNLKNEALARIAAIQEDLHGDRRHRTGQIRVERRGMDG